MNLDVNVKQIVGGALIDMGVLLKKLKKELLIDKCEESISTLKAVERCYYVIERAYKELFCNFVGISDFFYKKALEPHFECLSVDSVDEISEDQVHSLFLVFRGPNYSPIATFPLFHLKSHCEEEGHLIEYQKHAALTLELCKRWNEHSELKDIIQLLRNNITKLHRMLEEPPPTMPESCDTCKVVECHSGTKYGGETCVRRVRRSLRWLSQAVQVTDVSRGIGSHSNPQEGVSDNVK